MPDVLIAKPKSGIDRGDDDERELTGWWCIRHDPVPCDECGSHEFAEFRGKVIVWEERDDPIILRAAKVYRDQGVNPRIVEYEPMFGPCITWFRAEANGARIPDQPTGS